VGSTTGVVIIEDSFKGRWANEDGVGEQPCPARERSDRSLYGVIEAGE
jgi:hypothetical protein